jgi:hypothetical protein
MSDEDINFDAAESFVSKAREAYQRQDQAGFIAARKLVLVALGVAEAVPLQMKPRYSAKQ